MGVIRRRRDLRPCRRQHGLPHHAGSSHARLRHGRDKPARLSRTERHYEQLRNATPESSFRTASRSLTGGDVRLQTMAVPRRSAAPVGSRTEPGVPTSARPMAERYCGMGSARRYGSRKWSPAPGADRAPLPRVRSGSPTSHPSRPGCIALRVRSTGTSYPSVSDRVGSVRPLSLVRCGRLVDERRSAGAQSPRAAR